MQIERAKSLLADAHTKLTMVPSMCGYDSNPFFMKLFRKVTGLTMREWQRLRTERRAGLPQAYQSGKRHDCVLPDRDYLQPVAEMASATAET